MADSLAVKKLHDDKNYLESELDSLKHKITELNKENVRLSSSLEISLKQNEADLIMAKKNTELSKANYEKLQKELEHEKSLNNNLKTQIDQFKLQERLETKNHALLKKRIQELEEQVAKHNAHKDTDLKTLQEQVKSKQNQLDDEKAKWLHDKQLLHEENRRLEGKINEVYFNHSNIFVS